MLGLHAGATRARHRRDRRSERWSLSSNTCSLYRAGVQRSFDDLGTPLRDVTFCVLDLETTGPSPATDAITEIGAVKVRGGECLGTFHTLVNPGRAIPPQITVLTGITAGDGGPGPAGRGGAAVVRRVRRRHRDRRPQRPLRRRLPRRRPRPRRAGRACGNRSSTPAPWPGASCATRSRTAASARCRRRLRLDHQPTHRALDDALATTDLLHLLLERAAAFGVLGLDDLLALPRMDAHPQAAKLRLTTKLPRSPGRVPVRRRPRRGALRRQGHQPPPARPLVLLQRRAPQGRTAAPRGRRHPPRAVRLDARGRRHRDPAHPRATSPATTARDGAPARTTTSSSPSTRRSPGSPWCASARPDGVALPRSALRRPPRRGSSPRPSRPSYPSGAAPLATPKTGLPVRDAPCTPAQLGVATCPCAGQVDAGRLRSGGRARRARPHDRARRPARPAARPHARPGPAERFEEAADVRDRAAALAGALKRQRRVDGLRRAGVLRVALPRRRRRRGVQRRPAGLLVAPARRPSNRPCPSAPSRPAATARSPTTSPTRSAVIASWLDAEAARVRVLALRRRAGVAVVPPPVVRHAPVASHEHG